MMQSIDNALGHIHARQQSAGNIPIGISPNQIPGEFPYGPSPEFSCEASTEKSIQFLSDSNRAPTLIQGKGRKIGAQQPRFVQGSCGLLQGWARVGRGKENLACLCQTGCSFVLPDYGRALS